MVYVILFLGICVSSSAAILIRLCDASPLVIAAYRMSIAALLLIPISLIRHRAETVLLIRTRSLPVLAAGIFLALHFASWISSLSHTSVASSAFLVTTNPIFVGLGTWLILRERLNRFVVAGTAIAMAGTFWISYADFLTGEHAVLGDLLAVGGAIAMSGYLLVGRSQRADVALPPYVTVVYATAAILLVALVVSSGESLTGHTTRDYGLFAALAVGPQLLGHTSFNYALKRVSPALLALLLLIEPVLTSFLAQIILSEPPTSEVLAGGAAIILGIAIALVRETRVPIHPPT